MKVDQQISLALALGLAGFLSAEVAVRCSFEPGAMSEVFSEMGKPTVRYEQGGTAKQKPARPVMDELGVTALETFHDGGNFRYGVVDHIEGVRAKEGFTVSFRFRPRSRMRWRPIFGLRLGKHNYRLEQVAEVKPEGAITLALFRDNGQKLTEKMCSWHPKNSLILERWYDLRLCYKDECFVLYIDGTEVERLKVPAGHGLEDAVSELVLGTGRDGDGASSGVKPGLYARLDEVCLWPGTTEKPTPMRVAVAPAPVQAKPTVEIPAAAPDGSCVLAPKQGALPEWKHTLKGGTLRIQPAQASNPAQLTIEGQGRIELCCPFSDLTVRLDAKRFAGEVVLMDDATRPGRGKKLRCSGFELGPNARLVLAPGTQAYVVGQGPFSAPQISFGGHGEINAEGFGALRIEPGATLESAIEVTAPATIAATGAIKGRIFTQRGDAPLLTIGRAPDPLGQSRWVLPLLSGIKIGASLGTPDRPFSLLINSGSAELSGGSFARQVTVNAPVRLTGGKHVATELTIAPMQSVQVSGGATLEAKSIHSTGNLIIEREGTLASGCTVTGSCVLMDGAKLRIRPGEVATLSLLAMQHGDHLTITGEVHGMQGGKNTLLTWAIGGEALTRDDFLLAPDIPEGCELLFEPGKLSLQVPYAVAMGHLKTRVVNPDGAPAAVAPMPEATSFVVAAALQGAKREGELTLKMEGSTSESPEMDAGQAVNVAYLLNLTPQTSLAGGTLSAQYLCNFGVAEVRRVGNNRVEAAVMVEPFDGMGTLGSAPNGYIQILGKSDPADRQWAVLAEIAPGTPYRNGMVVSAPFRNVHGNKTFRTFGVRLSPTSARK